MQETIFDDFRTSIRSQLQADADLSFKLPVIDFLENTAHSALALAISPVIDLLPKRDFHLGRPVLITISALGDRKRYHDPNYMMTCVERAMHMPNQHEPCYEVLGLKLAGSQVGNRKIINGRLLKNQHFSLSYYATLYPKLTRTFGRAMGSKPIRRDEQLGAHTAEERAA